MLTHKRIWELIDALALRHGLSPSGLAKKAGLDPTTFNPSKRISPEGRMRWPSTESLAKIAEATDEPLHQILQEESDRPSEMFAMDISYDQNFPTQPTGVPMLGMAEAGAGGFYDSFGAPSGSGWAEIAMPEIVPEGAFALEVSGNSMLPAYRDRDVLIVSPSAQIRRGDRVVVRTHAGEVMAKILHRETQTQVELHSLNPDHKPRVIAKVDIASMMRILWASQ